MQDATEVVRTPTSDTTVVVRPRSIQGDIHELTGHDKLAFRLVCWLLLYVGIISTVALWDWIANAPMTPDLSGVAPEARMAVVQIYGSLNNAHVERVRSMVDLMTKPLYAMVLLLLGFLLWKRKINLQ